MRQLTPTYPVHEHSSKISQDLCKKETASVVKGFLHSPLHTEWESFKGKQNRWEAPKPHFQWMQASITLAFGKENTPTFWTLKLVSKFQFKVQLLTPDVHFDIYFTLSRITTSLNFRVTQGNGTSRLAAAIVLLMALTNPDNEVLYTLHFS